MPIGYRSVAKAAFGFVGFLGADSENTKAMASASLGLRGGCMDLQKGSLCAGSQRPRMLGANLDGD